MPERYRKLETLSRQPDFPNEDLNETNAAYIQYLLTHERADLPYAKYLEGSLRMVHIAGHQALTMTGISMEYSEKEYQSFCSGFAAMEYTTQLVRQQQYDSSLAIGKVRELFVTGADIAEFIILPRYDQWLSEHPKTNYAITSVGEEDGETTSQLYARSMGAHIASDLQQLT